MAKLKKQLVEEIKRWKLRFAGAGMMLLLVSVFAVIGTVAAKQGAFDWMAVQKDVANQIAESVVGEQEDTLGAVTSPFLNGPEFAIGNDLMYTVSVDLKDATTTFSVANPFRKATSTASDVVVEYYVGNATTGGKGWTVPTTTIELVRLDISSSTPSAYNIGCGTSDNKFATSTSGTTIAMVTSDAVPAAWAGGIIENDLATGAGAEVGGGSVEKVMIGPSHPYLVCKVDTAAPGEFTGTDSVDLGKMIVRYSRVRN